MKTQSNHNAILKANTDHKQENLSLFGIINYVAKNYHKKGEQGQAVREAFQHVPFIKDTKNKKEIIDRKLLDIDYIKTCLGAKQFKHKKNEAGELVPTETPKKYFSLFAIAKAITKHETSK